MRKTSIILLISFFISLNISAFSNDISLKPGEYNMKIANILDSIIGTDPEIRESIIKNLLGNLKGSEADTLRALIWAQESNLQLQDMLLKQISELSDSEILKTKKALSNLLSVYGEKQRNKRMREIEQILNNSSFSFVKTDEEILKNCKDSDSIVTTVDITILASQREVKSEAYKKIANFKGRLATEFRLLLWYSESDFYLQRLLLEQLRSAEDVRDISYVDRLIRFIQNQSDEQKRKRKLMIEELWNTKVEDQQ